MCILVEFLSQFCFCACPFNMDWWSALFLASYIASLAFYTLHTIPVNIIFVILYLELEVFFRSIYLFAKFCWVIFSTIFYLCWKELFHPLEHFLIDSTFFSWIVLLTSPNFDFVALGTYLTSCSIDWCVRFATNLVVIFRLRDYLRISSELKRGSPRTSVQIFTISCDHVYYTTCFTTL